MNDVLVDRVLRGGRIRHAGKVAVVVGLALLVVQPGRAEASPWTLPEDELVLELSHDFQVGRNEYLPDGEYQLFPLNGAFRSNNTRFGLRYGFTDRFEGAATFNIALVVYESDALILADLSEGASTGEATREILDFNSTRFGGGDVRLAGRYSLKNEGLVRITMESEVKLPTGYETPAGTFSTGSFLTIADDETEIVGQSTLGDGQTDLIQSVLLGAYLPPPRMFLRLDAGFKYRFGDPGNQVVGSFRAGKFLGESLLLMAGLGGHYTVVPGEVIGQTFVAVDPTVPAAEYSTSNVEILDVRMDSDALRAEIGALIQLGDFEFVGSFTRTIWGRNTTAVNSFSLSAIFVVPTQEE